MSKRKLTIRYVIFFIVFLPDAWQALIGLMAANFLTPLVGLQDAGFAARIMLFIMIATIGYAASTMPARWITRIIIKRILGEKRP